MIEDCILHPLLPLVLWLTAASSYGFVPYKQHIHACLSIVYQLAACSKRDPLSSSDEEFDDLPSIELINSLPPLEASLLKSIFARACFGGMQGDVRMLKKYVSLWYARFSGEIPVPTNSTWRDLLVSIYSEIETPVSLENVGCILPDDCVLSGVDFHCSNIIDLLLSKRATSEYITNYLQSHFGPEVSVRNKLEAMMWTFRSSINNKVPIYSDAASEEHDSKLSDLYSKFSAEIDRIAFEILHHKLV